MFRKLVIQTPNLRQAVKLWILFAESCILCCVTLRLLVAEVAFFDFLLLIFIPLLLSCSFIAANCGVNKSRLGSTSVLPLSYPTLGCLLSASLQMVALSAHRFGPSSAQRAVGNRSTRGNVVSGVNFEIGF
jgi:hypothetical protein